MTIDPLTYTHTIGNPIMVDEHANELSKLNDIISLVNTHTDLRFLSEKFGVLYKNEVEYAIQDNLYTGEVTDEIKIKNLNGKHLTSIVIKQTEYSGIYLGNIQLYDGESLSSNLIADFYPHKEIDYYDITEEDDSTTKVYTFHVGLLKLPDSKMLFRIKNRTGGGTIYINGIYFYGYG